MDFSLILCGEKNFYRTVILHFLLFSFCFLTAVACGKKNGEKITYRFAPELNKPVVYNLTTTTEINAGGKGVSSQMRMKMQMTPTARENGVTTISTQILDMSVSTGNEEADRSMEQSMQQFKQLFSKLHVIVQANERGNSVGKTTYEGLPKEYAAMLQSQMGASTDLSNNLKYFPEYPIGQGDSWTSKTHTDKVDCDAVYTLEKVTDDVLTVSFKGKMTRKNNPQGTIDITVQGSSQYNRKTGMTIPGTFTAESKASSAGQQVKSTVSM